VAGLKRIVIPYRPRDQFKPFHYRGKRWSVLVAHRRCGKTVATINDLVRRASGLKQDHGRFAYVAPFLAQAKEVAWEYLKRYSLPITIDKNEAELWVELMGGSRIRIHGADNPDRLRGAYLDGVVLDEFADMRAGVFGEVIRPMLADRQGWATFIGTPKGKNEFWRLWKMARSHPDWFALMLKASETGILPISELDAARGDMTPEQYEQEFECSFDAAIIGAYYAREIAASERAGRICDVPVSPDLPVHTAWDLGVGDSTAIWFFQVAGNEVRVVDYYESNNVGLDHYAGVLRERGYRYADDWVPHDAKVRELGTGRTRIETLHALGRRPVLVPDHGLMDGINATRLTLANCWFDATRTAQGLEALRQYRADFDDKLKAFKDKPRHDWTSHAADAFRYLAMAWRAMTPKLPAPPLPIGVPLNELTWDQFFDLNERPKGITRV